MQKWEYCYIDDLGSRNFNFIHLGKGQKPISYPYDQLNEVIEYLGEHGWELVNLVLMHGTAYWVFKRPKSEN